MFPFDPPENIRKIALKENCINFIVQIYSQVISLLLIKDVIARTKGIETTTEAILGPSQTSLVKLFCE